MDRQGVEELVGKDDAGDGHGTVRWRAGRRQESCKAGLFEPVLEVGQAVRVRFDGFVTDGRQQVGRAVAAKSFEDRKPERARPGAVLDQVERTRLAQLGPHPLDPAGDGPAEDRMCFGRGQEVAGVGRSVGRLTVVAELGLVESAFHETGEGDAALGRRFDIGADEGGQTGRTVGQGFGGALGRSRRQAVGRKLG